MVEKRVKVIRMKAGMTDPKGILIPRGVREEITIEIIDGIATYWFKSKSVTRKFAMIEIEGEKKNKKDPTVIYVDRIGKAVKKYDGKTKEEIRDLISEQLNQLNIKAKIR